MTRGLIFATRLASCTAAVQLAGDGVGHVGQLLLLLLEVLSRGRGSVLLEPLGSLLDSVQDLVRKKKIVSMPASSDDVL